MRLAKQSLLVRKLDSTSLSRSKKKELVFVLLIVSGHLVMKLNGMIFLDAVSLFCESTYLLRKSSMFLSMYFMGKLIFVRSCLILSTSAWKLSQELQILKALNKRHFIRPDLYLSGHKLSYDRHSLLLVGLTNTEVL